MGWVVCRGAGLRERNWRGLLAGVLAVLVVTVPGCGRRVEYPVGQPIAIANLTITPTHYRMDTIEEKEVAVIFLRIDGLPEDFLAKEGKDAKRWAKGKGLPGAELRIYDSGGKQQPAFVIPEEMFDAVKSLESGNKELAGQRFMDALLKMTALGSGMPRDWVLIAELPRSTPDFALLIKNLERRKGQPPAALVVFKKR